MASSEKIFAEDMRKGNLETLCPNCKKNNLCGASFLAYCKECWENSRIYKSGMYKKFIRDGE